MKNLLALKEYYLKNRWWLILGFLSLVLVDGLQLIIPRVIKWAVDDLTAGGIVRAHLLRYAGYIAVIALGIGLFRYFWRYCIIGTARRIEEDLRNRLFGHLQTLSCSFFNRTKTGDLMARATNDINAVRMAAGIGLVVLTDIIVLGTASIGFMLYISPRLTLFALLPAPVLILIVVKFGSLIHKRFEEVQATFADLTERARENISGIRVVKAYVQESNEIGKFGGVSQNYVNKNMNLVRIWGAFFPMIMFFAHLGIAIVLLLGGRLVILNSISMGDFVAFAGYLEILIWPILGTGWVINLLQRGAASMGRISRILQEKPDIADSPSVIQLASIEGRIDFRDLSFSYDKGLPPVLEHISLTIEPGETVALVGRTGAGKTTLVNLIPRVFDPREGELFIDGKEIHTIPLKTLRGSIGYVPQDTFLFSDTLNENIAFGRLDAEDEETAKVTELVHMHDEVSDFADDLETVIGERGVTLSGGQKQRVAIARALLLDPPVLILDDCFSSVDTDTEREILKDLEPVIQRKTTILISHRISTVKRADRIYVLDGGGIVEQGNHEELLHLKGIYSSIYRKQQLEERMEKEIHVW